MTVLLRTDGLTKRFGDLVANDGIDLKIEAGELHCLFGENGAGKSTLSACLYGYQMPDAGSISINGEVRDFSSPADAIAAGIGMVHQHFVLVENLTVLENIIVGTHAHGWRLNERESANKLRSICERYGITVKLEAYIWQLSVGEQQWVEILKALFLDTQLLILDEPTAVLTPQESARLFEVVKTMRARGLAVVIITHKLAEVMKSDRVTVLRKGRKVATVKTSETTPESLTEMMIGRASDAPPDKSTREPGRVVVQIADLCLTGVWGETLVDNVSLMVRSGEILGVAGVAGNGQKQLLDMLAGIIVPDSGSIAIGDHQLEGLGPDRYMAAGVGIIPEDRYAEGLLGDFSIADNIVLGSQRAPALRSLGFVDAKKVRQRAEDAITEFAIAAPDVATPVRNLSGGNAQKVVLARELRQARVLLLANQPTRGLDVGIVTSVHRRLLEKRQAGCAIVLASEDLDDLLALSDRIAVMFAGRIVAILDPAATNVEEIGAYMAGRSADRAA